MSTNTNISTNADFFESSKRHFEQHNYVVFRNFIDRILADYIFHYSVMRHNRLRFFKQVDWPYHREDDGVLKDRKTNDTYACYGDPAMDTLLALGVQAIEKIIGKTVVPQYSYWRLYKKGDEIYRHTDGMNAEIAATLCLGYSGGHEKEPWPIFIDGTGGTGLPGTAAFLNPGDILIYRGQVCEHWREPYQGDFMAQVFLFYNEAEGPFSHKKFDGRPLLGLPFCFSNRISPEDVKK